MKPAGTAQLAHLYLDIALLRRGPEDVPASGALLAATFAANFVVSFLSYLLMSASGLQTAGQLLASDAFMLACYRGALVAAGRPERFAQTATALLGYQTLLAPLIIAGSSLVLRHATQPPEQIPFAIAALGLLMFLLFAWTLAVNGRILRAATGWPLFACVSAVVLQLLAEMVLIQALFGSTRET
jgi:hypothetical protein